MKRPERKMTIEERAKQFMPFSPLKGFDDAVLKKQFVKEPRKEITDDMAVKINNTLTSLLNGDIVTLVWYNNGCYQQITGEFTKLDLVKGIIVLGEKKIKIDLISDAII